MDSLPFLVSKHESILIRTLGNCDLQLQHNKVTNLKLAVQRLDGLLLLPGETFSIYRSIGRPGKRKGYLTGLELSAGRASSGVGGGLCQIANMLHWLVLQSELNVIERHHHSIDPFPDDGRVIPFGTGATLYYNFKDFRFENRGKLTYQLRFIVSDMNLIGELRASELPPFEYKVYEKNHRFEKRGDQYWRLNELWRDTISQDTVVDSQLLFANEARTMYVPASFEED